MSRRLLVASLVLITGVFHVDDADAGAFILSENTGLDIRFILHPKNYAGAGGALNNSVCLNTSLLPTGVSATQVENTVLKVIDTWNARRSAINNLKQGSNNDLQNSQFDYESALLHEMGHCIGLAHPNLATESGLNDPERNSTQARSGSNGVFNTNAGADGNFGSRDDTRGDDVNRYWFFPSSNDPLALPSIIDTTTFTEAVGSRPAGSSWIANADRSVLADLGYLNTESTMQQGQFNDEAQRRATAEDVSTLRIGMSGLDGLQGTSDDYTPVLNYGGRVTSNSCDINVAFSASTSFAACSIGANLFTSFPTHGVITSANITMSPTATWFFSQAPNTQTSISSISPTSPPSGSPATVSIAVTRLSALMTGTPPGTFEVTLAGGSCSGSLSSGTGSCQLTPATTGNQTARADYLGFEGFDSSFGTRAATVVGNTPTVTITSDAPDPSAAGQSYTVAVSVSGSVGTPTGSVSVSDGSVSCPITLSGGSGSCALTSTTVGAKILTASYAGNASYGPASDTEPHTVNQATPTVIITSDNPDPSLVGQSYTVVATVTGAAGTPTGSVSVSDGSTNCSFNLAGGTGNCALISNTAGATTLTASYAGNATYNAASDTEPHTVNKATPTVTITSDNPDPSAIGQAYTVAVLTNGNVGAPTGTVAVSDGAVNCVVTLANGFGSCMLTSTTAGAKTLTANYSGNASYLAASDTEPHTVNKATPTVTITSDAPDPSVVGQSYTVAVTVAGSVGTPTGAVNVTDGSVNCAITLSAGGGSCALASTISGARNLTASYAGNASYNAANDTEPHTVNKLDPTVTITSDAPDPSTVGQSYTVTVSVTGSNATPSGSVIITDGVSSCPIALNNGSGSCGLASTSAGEKTLNANYIGDGIYNTANDTEPHSVVVGSVEIFQDGFEGD